MRSFVRQDSCCVRCVVFTVQQQQEQVPVLVLLTSRSHPHFQQYEAPIVVPLAGGGTLAEVGRECWKRGKSNPYSSLLAGLTFFLGMIRSPDLFLPTRRAFQRSKTLLNETNAGVFLPRPYQQILTEPSKDFLYGPLGPVRDGRVASVKEGLGANQQTDCRLASTNFLASLSFGCRVVRLADWLSGRPPRFFVQECLLLLGASCCCRRG